MLPFAIVFRENSLTTSGIDCIWLESSLSSESIILDESPQVYSILWCTVCIIQLRTKCKVFRKGSFELMSGFFLQNYHAGLQVGMEKSFEAHPACSKIVPFYFSPSFKIWKFQLILSKEKEKFPSLIFPVVVVTNASPCLLPQLRPPAQRMEEWWGALSFWSHMAKGEAGWEWG